MSCSQCGSQLQLDTTQSVVECPRCGAIYDVIRTSNKVHGQITIDLRSLAIGVFAGLSAGVTIGTILTTYLVKREVQKGVTGVKKLFRIQ